MSDLASEGFSAQESIERMAGGGRGNRWLTPASIGLSLVLVALLAYFLPYLYMKLNVKALAGGYLPLLAVFPFLALLWLNGLLRRTGIGLAQGELTVVLCALMVSLSTLMTVVWLFSSLPSPVNAANPGNKFKTMFLWSVDTRLLPYTIEDKEREKSAGQYDESLTWFYSGLPELLPPERKQKTTAKAGGAEAATTPPAAVEEEPAKLKIPWFRWARRYTVSGERRVRAYDRLARQVRNADGLDEKSAQALLAQIGVLRENAAASKDRPAAYRALFERLRDASSRAAYDRMLEAVKNAEDPTPAARSAWLSDIQRLRDSDTKRLKDYEDFAERIKKTEDLEPPVVEAVIGQLEVLKRNLTTTEDSPKEYEALFGELRHASSQAAYETLLKLLEETEGLRPDTRRDLTLAVYYERDLDRYLATHKVPTQRRLFDKPWMAWTGPLVWWLILLFLFVILQFCVAALLRRQWVDHEKLLFPHVEILEAVAAPGPGGTPGGSIVRNRLMWIGFGAAVLLFAMDGLATYFSGFPGIKWKDLSLAPMLTEDPWKAIPSALDLHLFVVAIAFLLPAEISLSIWLFVLMDMALAVYLRATGHTFYTEEPIRGYLINGGADQMAGIVIFMGALIYSGRRHFIGVLRKAFGGGKDIDDSEEPLPYFGAFWGLVLSGVGIIMWCYIMGMSPFLSLLIFVGTVLAIMFLARLVCELGIVTGTFQEWSTPHYFVAGLFGYRPAVGRMTLWHRLMFFTPTFSTWSFIWMGLFYGTHVMPMAMTSERMFRHGQSRRRFTFFLMVLTLGALVVFATRTISVTYKEGAINLKQGRHSSSAASHTFNNTLTRDFIRKQKAHKPYPPIYWSAIAGTIIMTVLLALRHMFYWWPLHPVGYICAGLAGGVWFSVFIGWLIKRAILKYGGGRLFRTVIPLFVGLLIGHFVVAGIWMIVGASLEAAKVEGLYSAIWCQPYGR